jgi:hypothetical protein
MDCYKNIAMVILIFSLGYAILISCKTVENHSLFRKQRKKPQGAGELLGLF